MSILISWAKESTFKTQCNAENACINGMWQLISFERKSKKLQFFPFWSISLICIRPNICLLTFSSWDWSQSYQRNFVFNSKICTKEFGDTLLHLKSSCYFCEINCHKPNFKEFVTYSVILGHKKVIGLTLGRQEAQLTWSRCTEVQMGNQLRE